MVAWCWILGMTGVRWVVGHGMRALGWDSRHGMAWRQGLRVLSSLAAYSTYANMSSQIIFQESM